MNRSLAKAAALAAALCLAPLTAGAAPTPDDPPVAQLRPGAPSSDEVDGTESLVFGGYRREGGDDVRAVLKVPELECDPLGTDNGVFPGLGVRDEIGEVVYSGVLALCRRGEPRYSAALYAPGVERHFRKPALEPGDRVRVAYHAAGREGVVRVQNLTQGWQRRVTRFVPPVAERASIGNYVVSRSGVVLPVAAYWRHPVRNARIDGRPVDGTFERVDLHNADGSLRAWPSRAVDGDFAMRALGRDPDLEDGFPVSIRHGHVYQAGVRINATVADLDGDPELEICGTGLGPAPVTCWEHDGEVVDDWPTSSEENHGAGYVSVGDIGPGGAPGVVITYDFGGMTATDGRGRTLPGWPRPEEDSGIPATIAADVLGRPMIVLGQLEGLDALDTRGRSMPGWPVEPPESAHFQTPAVADVDGEPGVEIFTVGSNGSPGRIYAYHEDGTPLAGYPQLVETTPYTYPALGDVDGDGAVELVVVGEQDDSPFRAVLSVYEAATGRLEGRRVLGGQLRSDGVVALADLDGACGPGTLLHMIVQSAPMLEAVSWDGTEFRDRPGFPVDWGDQWVSNSAPVVGDVDGDGSPDIVFTGQDPGDGEHGSVHAYDADGRQLRHFPKHLSSGSGGVPAIADVDLDGRNEIVVKGSYTRDETSTPSIWLYDLRTGGPSAPPEWGQFMSTSDHRSAYESPTC